MVEEVGKDESADEEEVFVVEEHVTTGKLAIAARSSNLLDVIFDGLGHVIVNN